MDPLSDVLSLLKPRSYISAGLNAGGDWSLVFPAHEGIKFNAVMRGACWVSVEGVPEAQRLEEGDCFLLTRGRPFILTTDLTLEPVDSHRIYDAAQDGVATCNDGGDFFLVGGRFAFAGDHVDMLFGALPPIVHVRESSSHASVLRWSLNEFASELGKGELGGVLIVEHLAHIMLVQALRLYLTSSADGGVGWFFALSDHQIGDAVRAMHADPAHRWTLEELGRLAGMSRTTFAQKFKQRVGTTAMDYLTRWRMLIAGDRLRNSRENVASIAFSLGYESESAFSMAFKRTMACSPRQYQRQHAI
ncbi:transcriptional regulator, AraC family [Arboricoccus pini]|uniref:Transcriptional regulator, AraC family n=1 Tax=Arboricoccus pini TaxID=1963835 RepID=A0A212R0U9_9PROT|nr:AraC family transcriptional regulator [Arboricoccus pini]SNB65561.1 transcriptional regulator, AraC family [Arboricoccus pini]